MRESFQGQQRLGDRWVLGPRLGRGNRWSFGECWGWGDLQLPWAHRSQKLHLFQQLRSFSEAHLALQPASVQKAQLGQGGRCGERRLFAALLFALGCWGAACQLAPRDLRDPGSSGRLSSHSVCTGSAVICLLSVRRRFRNAPGTVHMKTASSSPFFSHRPSQHFGGPLPSFAKRRIIG